MAIYLSNRDGHGVQPSLTNEEGHFRFQTKTWAGDVLGGSGNELAVTESAVLGMTVDVDTGDWKIDTTGYSYTGWNDAKATVTVATSNPSNPRIDAVVLYVDLSEDTTNTSNNPGIAKLKAVTGNPAASPSNPSDATIKSSIGSSNPYIILAYVLVGAGVTQITTSNVTDARTFVTIAPANSVTTGNITDSSVTTAKLASKAVTTSKINGGTTAGVLTTNASGSVSATPVQYIEQTTLNPQLTVSTSGLYRIDASLFGYSSTVVDTTFGINIAGTPTITRAVFGQYNKTCSFTIVRNLTASQVVSTTGSATSGGGTGLHTLALTRIG